MQPPLQSRTCKRPSLPPKGNKINLSCHFSVRAHYNCTLQQKLAAITGLEDPYLRGASKVNLSPTQSPNIEILLSVIVPSALKLVSLQWGIGAPPIRYRINTSTKQHLKTHKYLEEFTTKSNLHYKVKTTFGVLFYTLSLIH